MATAQDPQRVYPEDLHLVGVDKPHKAELQAGPGGTPTGDETQLRRVALDVPPEFLEGVRLCGVITPVVVRPIPGRKADARVRYEVVEGRQRVKAARLVNESEGIKRDIPIIVRRGDDSRTVSIVQAMANAHRIEDSIYERSRQAVDLRNRGLPIEQVALVMNVAQATLSRWLRFQDEAPPALHEAVKSEKLGFYEAIGRLALAKDASPDEEGEVTVDVEPAPQPTEKKPRGTKKAQSLLPAYAEWARGQVREGIEYRRSRRTNPQLKESDIEETVSFLLGDRAELPYWLENAISHPTTQAPARPQAPEPAAPKTRKTPATKVVIEDTEDDDTADALEIGGEE